MIRLVRKLRQIIVITMMFMFLLAFPIAANCQRQGLEHYAGVGLEGFSDGRKDAAIFNQPTDITIDNMGDLVIVDAKNHRIRKVQGNTVTTVAGSFNGFDKWGFPMGGYQDGSISKAMFNKPRGVAVDSQNNIYRQPCNKKNHWKPNLFLATFSSML